jgi:hypothetical protein
LANAHTNHVSFFLANHHRSKVDEIRNSSRAPRSAHLLLSLGLESPLPHLAPHLVLVPSSCSSFLLPSAVTQQHAGWILHKRFWILDSLQKGFWTLLDSLQSILGKGFWDSGFVAERILDSSGFFAKYSLGKDSGILDSLQKGFWTLLDSLQSILGKGFSDSGFFTLQLDFILFCRFRSYDEEHFKLIVIYNSLFINK